MVLVRENYNFPRIQRASYIFMGVQLFSPGVGEGVQMLISSIESHITCDFPGSCGISSGSTLKNKRSSDKDNFYSKNYNL